jgi:hypothetical protein
VRATFARARPAGDADGRFQRIWPRAEGIAVDDLFGIGRVATKHHGVGRARRAETDRALAQPAGNEDIPLPLGHDRHLRDGPVARGKCDIDCPQGAGAAKSRHGQTRHAKGLGQVPGRIRAQEHKGDAFRAGPPQCDEPVCDLLETAVELQAQPFDVIPLRSGRFQKRVIGKQNGAGGIVGQGVPGPMSCFVAGQTVRRRQCPDQGPEFEFHQRARQLEAGRRRQRRFIERQDTIVNPAP